MEETSAVDWMLKKAEQETKGFRPWRKRTRVNSYVECLVPQQNVRFELYKLKKYIHVTWGCLRIYNIRRLSFDLHNLSDVVVNF